MGAPAMEGWREREQPWQGALVGVVLLLLATAVGAALSAEAVDWACAGMLAIWAVLLAWGLWTWRALLPPAPLWWMAGAGGVALFAQFLLLLSGPTVFMQVNFVSLLAWALLCAATLSVYAIVAPREERRYIILTIAGTVLLVALLPLTPRPFVAEVVGGALGVLPAVMAGSWLLRDRLAGGWSLAMSGPRKLAAWPVAGNPDPSAPISN